MTPIYKLITTLLLIGCLSTNAQPIMGFASQKAAAEIEVEKHFDASLNTSDQDAWMKFLSSHPHHVGSAQGKINADYLASLFKQWGYQTEIKKYDVLFPTPKTRILELLGDKPYKAKLEELSIAEDHTSGQKSEQLPSYNAYSADGDVTSELVFVNRGIPADYEELEKLGISVKGKIVLAKYGGSWRGIKPKVAYEHGAVGCIIYSDPADDGYGAGDTYPKGPFRPANGVQRGSVMDMPVYPGDPLTPGFASLPGAKRLERKDAVTIMKIPVLPISYEDALPLFQSLGGQPAPKAWTGGLPVTYHIGPSVQKVHLKLAFNWDTKPIYDVIARIQGKVFPDEWVLRGNHHDGWVNGAADPLSGLVAELSEAKAIGVLMQQGFQPKRTIVYCAWDGEEPSLLGSTEWAEDHQDELRKKAVVYINSDGNGRGFVNAEGSQTLEPFFNEVLDQVKDPETGVTVRERRWAKDWVDATQKGKPFDASQSMVKMDGIGAGSDYSPFIQHMGIPSISLGFGGENEGGEYHSIYDSYDMFTRFKDPGFKYGVALAQTAGRLVLRMANADRLPFRFWPFYMHMAEYSREVKELADKERQQTNQENELIRKNYFKLSSDPSKPYIQPAPKPQVPYLNFSDLDNALVTLKALSDSLESLYDVSGSLAPDQLTKLNQTLFHAEQALISAKGLPRRPWYKHEIYAPGYYTGYGVKTLPEIREAIEQRNWPEAQDGIKNVSQSIQAYNEKVREATQLLAKPAL